MSVVIKAVGFANGTPCPHEGQYLKSFDPDAENGRGFTVFTRDRAKAQMFVTAADAFLCWKQQSKVKPLRPDGKPNRPLTALSIVIEPGEEK